MTRLFAEHFAVPPKAGLPPEETQYDETRSLNLDSAGRPCVEIGVTERTRTITEVRGEEPDPDEDDEFTIQHAMRAWIGTETKVRGESADLADDFEFGIRILEVETKVKPESERAMRQPWMSALDTDTDAVQAERPDRERDDLAG